MRKEIITNCKYKTAGKYHKPHMVQKNDLVVLLTNCLQHSVVLFFFLHFLAANSLIFSSHHNDFVTSFSVDIIERLFSLSFSMVHRNWFLFIVSLDQFLSGS